MNSGGLSQLLAPFGPVFRGANVRTSDVEDLRRQLHELRSSQRPLLKIMNNDIEGTRMFTVEFKPHEASTSLIRKDVAGHLRLHCLDVECVSKVRGKPKLFFFTKDVANSPFLCLLSIRVSLGTAHEDAYHRLRVITGREDAEAAGFEPVSEHKTTIVATALTFTPEALSERLLAIENLINQPVKIPAEMPMSSVSPAPLTRRTRQRKERRRCSEEEVGPRLYPIFTLLRIFKGRLLLVLLVLLAVLYLRPTEKPQMRTIGRPLLEGPSNFFKLLSSPCGNDNLLQVYEIVREELMTQAHKVWQLDRMIVPIKKGHAPWMVGRNREDGPSEVYMEELADLTFEVLDILENDNQELFPQVF